MAYFSLCITQVKPLDASLALLKGIEKDLKEAFKLTFKILVDILRCVGIALYRQCCSKYAFLFLLLRHVEVTGLWRFERFRISPL